MLYFDGGQRSSRFPKLFSEILLWQVLDCVFVQENAVFRGEWAALCWIHVFKKLISGENKYEFKMNVKLWDLPESFETDWRWSDVSRRSSSCHPCCSSPIHSCASFYLIRPGLFQIISNFECSNKQSKVFKRRNGICAGYILCFVFYVLQTVRHQSTDYCIRMHESNVQPISYQFLRLRSASFWC